MRRYLKFEIILPVVAAVMTVVITLLRTLAICFGYDADVGYYETGNVYVICAGLLTGIYIALAFGLSVLSCLGRLVPSDDPRPARLSALALGCAICLFSFAQFENGFSDSVSDICLLVSVIFSLLGLSFCALTFLRVNTLERLRTLGGLFLAMAFLVRALYQYFRTDMPINGDIKLLYVFSSLSAGLFFLSEAKRSLYKQNSVSARFFALCCCLLCVSAGVSEFASFFLKKEAFSETYTHPILLIFVGLYAFARLFAARVPVAGGEKQGIPESQSTDAEPDTVSSQDTTPEETVPSQDTAPEQTASPQIVDVAPVETENGGPENNPS